jgi:hypothetical protein
MLSIFIPYFYACDLGGEICSFNQMINMGTEILHLTS